MTCPQCAASASQQELAENLLVCPSCAFHFRMEPYERIAYIADPGSFVEFDHDLTGSDPLALPGYAEKIADVAMRTKLPEAVITGSCAIGGRPAVLAVMSFSFIGGSMGTAVGEKITRAMKAGLERNEPVVIFTASGGARMQEGIFSLMQMEKTAAAAGMLDRAGVPLFTVLCDPTTGGVTGSFAMLGDVIIAEPGAFIGFSGPRVIEAQMNRKVPDNVERVETLLEKGLVDLVVPRKDQRALLARLIEAHSTGSGQVAPEADR